MNGIRIDRWPEGRKTERLMETDARSRKQKAKEKRTGRTEEVLSLSVPADFT